MPLSCTHNPITDFKKGIKCDPSLFSVYKDKKQWDQWQCLTMAQAHAQDVTKVLVESYTPNTGPDTELFIEKQKFMYAVFECTLQTDQGKALVHKYKSTFEAQCSFMHPLSNIPSA
jgi:hypothetical protein